MKQNRITKKITDEGQIELLRTTGTQKNDLLLSSKENNPEELVLHIKGNNLEEEKRESLDRTIRAEPPSFNISASII